jgi:hypothetical protein
MICASTPSFPSEHVDARDTSASTRVFDALLPAHDGLPHRLFMIPGTISYGEVPFDGAPVQG